MQIFPRETTDYIAEQLYSYFRRKTGTEKYMRVRDARMLVDAIQPGGEKPPDTNKVRYIIERSETLGAWDKVFDETLRRCQTEPKAENVIMLAFRDCENEENILKLTEMSRRSLYDYKLMVLTIAAVLAYKKDLISFY